MFQVSFNMPSLGQSSVSFGSYFYILFTIYSCCLRECSSGWQLLSDTRSRILPCYFFNVVKFFIYSLILILLHKDDSFWPFLVVSSRNCLHNQPIFKFLYFLIYQLWTLPWVGGIIVNSTCLCLFNFKSRHKEGK